MPFEILPMPSDGMRFLVPHRKEHIMSTTDRMMNTAAFGERNFVARLATEVATVAKTVKRALRNRFAIYRIADLDDHQLRDIGLKRSDVENAAGAAGVLEDPFDFLPISNSPRLRR